MVEDVANKTFVIGKNIRIGEPIEYLWVELILMFRSTFHTNTTRVAEKRKNLGFLEESRTKERSNMLT